MKQFRSFFSPLSLGERSGVRLLLLASVFLASCGEQTEIEQPVVDNGATVAVTKEIKINLLPMQTMGGGVTRAASQTPAKGEAIGITYGEDASTRGTMDMTGAESQINNAYILQFDGTASASVLKTVKEISKEELNGVAPITCSFNMAPDKKNRVYVVANLTAEQITAITAAKLEGDKEESTPLTLEAFEQPVSFSASESLPETGLPMSAMQDIGVGDVFDVFRLKSVLAKLTFTCKTDGATLTLKGIPSAYSLAKVQPGDVAVRPADVTYSTEVALTSGTAYYVPENLSGCVNLSSSLVRCSLFAPDNSMFVEIGANDTKYNIYLGDGSAQDFNFVGGYAYNTNATIYGTSDLDWRVGVRSVEALDGKGETANCYIPAEADKWYSFNATVMGNGVVTPAHNVGAVAGDGYFDAIVPSTLNPASAEVLWETQNSAAAPTKGSIVNNTVYLAKGRVLFKSGSTNGNAVIAVRDASGTIIWSWHIWRIAATPSPITLKAITGVGGNLKLMDRNLGALAATTEATVASIGFYYQWGRKDPFPGAATLSSTNTDFAKATNVNFAADKSSVKSSVQSAIASPTTFYNTGSDWCSTRNDNLWGSPLTEEITIGSNKFNKNAGSKSIYDPCPAGWRVAPSYTYANMTKPVSTFTNGFDFDGSLTDAGTKLFISASGNRGNSSGSLGNVGSYGFYWSSSPGAASPTYGGNMYFGQGSVYPSNFNFRASGFGVRCAQ